MVGYLVELRRQLEAEVAWTRPENLHVTLKFLGSVPAAALETVGARLATIASAQRAFEIAFADVGGFPSLARARVLWIGAAAAALAPLAAEIDEAAAAIGVAREERPYRPHVTLGRVRGHGKGRRRPAALPEGLRTALEGARARPFGIASARSLVLFRSDTDPRGARYTALGRFALGG